METEGTMKIGKKVYTAPELVEHGDLIDITQTGTSGPTDAQGGDGSGIVESPYYMPPIP